ncbi:MAG: GDSL-type esterase/lipase family protein [Acidobacteriota bacterium]
MSLALTSFALAMRSAALKNLALAVASTTTFFVLLEGVLRILGLPRPETRQPGMVRQDGRTSSSRHGAGPAVRWVEMNGWMSPDPELGWRFRPNQTVTERSEDGLAWSFTTTTLACRGPELPGPPDVICMGDSVTAGFGVSQGGPYPEVLQEILHARRPCTVLNGGVDGHSSEQGRAHLRRMLERFDPAVVTIGYGINDDWRASLPDPILSAGETQHGLASAVIWIQRTFGRMRTYRLLKGPAVRWKMERAAREGRAVARVAPERYAENLRAMVDMVRADGAVPIFVTPTSKWEWGVKDPERRPGSVFIEYPMRLYRNVMAAVALEKGVERIELPLLSGYLPESELRFVDWCHPDAEGLCAIAGELAPAIDRAMTRPPPAP